MGVTSGRGLRGRYLRDCADRWPLPFCSLLPDRHEVSSFPPPCLSTTMFLPQHWLKAMEPATMDWSLLKVWTTADLSSCSCVSQAFCQSNSKVTKKVILKIQGYFNTWKEMDKIAFSVHYKASQKITDWGKLPQLDIYKKATVEIIFSGRGKKVKMSVLTAIIQHLLEVLASAVSSRKEN